LFSLAGVIILGLCLMIACFYAYDGNKGQESQIHCRGVVSAAVGAAGAAAAAAAAAHGGCG
jgi:hypothetical protein